MKKSNYPGLFSFLLILTIFWGCKKDASVPYIPQPGSGIKTSANWGVPQTTIFDNTFEKFFNPVNIIEIHISISVAEWNGMLNDYDKNNKNEMCRQASCRISGGGIDTSFVSVGLRLRGNTSRRRPEIGTGNHDSSNQLERVHFKIKFNNTFDKDESTYGPPSMDVVKNTTYKTQQLMTNVAALNLKYNKDDPSYIREAFSYDMYRRFGVEAVRSTFAKFYIKIANEAERYLGVYLAFEDIDKTWIRKRFNENDGTLFKCLWQDFGPADLSQSDYDGSLLTGRIGQEITDPKNNIAFLSGFYQYHPDYDLKEDPFNTGVDSLNEFITLLNNHPTKEQLEKAFDVQAFLRALAVNVMIGMADDYWRGGNNYYLYTNPSNQNKWTYFPYDNDRTFGLNTFGPETATSSVIKWGDNSGTACNPVLVNAILSIPQFMTDYKAYLTYMIDKGYFTEERVTKRIEEMQSAIISSVYGYNVGNDYFPFSSSVTKIAAFVKSRVDVVNKECR